MISSRITSEKLQVLLGYAGRNKHGRKHELVTKALHLVKAGSSPAVHMKIKELYRRRFPAKMVSHSELSLPGPHHPATAGLVGGGGAALPAGLTQLAYEGHAGHSGTPSPAALLPLSLLGPGKHEFTGLTHHLSAAVPLHPVHPDVTLQRLPFYDMLDELIKPTSLASDNSQRFQETCFAFALTPQQVQQISSSMDISGTKCDFSVQVQLRFCLSETSCPQEDHFPPSLCVKVNGKPCNLPVRNTDIHMQYPSTQILCFSLYFKAVLVISPFFLPSYLTGLSSSNQKRCRAKAAQPTHQYYLVVKEKLTADPDSEIATTSLRVSLLCPLGKMRLMIPCRALTCSHLQCFDATLYIQMNEKKPTWVCPVCDKKAPYELLIIDGLFVEILNSCTDCDEIQFKEDGNWAPMRTKKELQEVSCAALNSSLNGKKCTSPLSANHNNSGNSKKMAVIDLTLDSSSEDEEQDTPPLLPMCDYILVPTSASRVLNLHHQASPVSRTPSMPAVDSSYMPPVPPLIQDYRPYYHTTNDLPDLNFFSFLQGDNHQHYNMVMAAAAAASASEDHELLLNRFLPYSSSGSSASLLTPPTNGAGGSGSSSSSSSLVSSGSLRDAHSLSSHSHGGVLAGRGAAEAAVAAIYGGIPDVISLD
uniref:Protein inhibitor of activated STAT 1 n=1 Tax=Hippocampus comes TaxID=109280 RepID=A0A3Q2Z7P1_HIPCM